jgi:hypothetical protein
MSASDHDTQGKNKTLHGVTFDAKRGNYKTRIHFDGCERFIGR